MKMNDIKLGILAAASALLQIAGQAASPPDFVRVEVKASRRWWEASNPTINIKMRMRTNTVSVQIRSVEWYWNGTKVQGETNLSVSIPFKFDVANEYACSLLTSVDGKDRLDNFVAADTTDIYSAGLANLNVTLYADDHYQSAYPWRGATYMVATHIFQMGRDGVPDPITHGILQIEYSYDMKTWFKPPWVTGDLIEIGVPVDWWRVGQFYFFSRENRYFRAVPYGMPYLEEEGQ